MERAMRKITSLSALALGIALALGSAYAQEVWETYPNTAISPLFGHHPYPYAPAGTFLGVPSAAAGAYAYEPATAQECAQRFKSYNPRSGTYLGRDGYRHSCP